jgi:hypothetical protein
MANDAAASTRRMLPSETFTANESEVLSAKYEAAAAITFK